MRAPVGRHITAGLDAQTPGVRTTRLLRPRTFPPAIPDGWRALAVEAEQERCQRRVVPRRRLLTECPPCNQPRAPPPSRPPHPCPRLVTIAKRPCGGRDGAIHTIKPNFCKCEYFMKAILTQSWRVSPEATQRIVAQLAPRPTDWSTRQYPEVTPSHTYQVKPSACQTRRRCGRAKLDPRAICSPDPA